MKKILSVDAETDGLWGNSPFWIAAIVYNEEGLEIDKINVANKFIGKLVTDDWVKENVLPVLKQDKTVKKVSGFKELYKEFADFYNKYREDSTVLWHMGHIVESHLFRELHSLNLIGDWDAPYNPIEVAEILRQNNEKPDSVDSYIEKYDITVNDYGTTHNPLYDCEAAAKVYFSLRG